MAHSDEEQFVTKILIHERPETAALFQKGTDMSVYEIVDERQTPKGKSAPNAQRYLRAERETIHRAIREQIARGGIKDLGDGNPKQVKIKRGGLVEPVVDEASDTGRAHHVLPGNKQFVKGDRLPRREQEERSSGGSPDGEGEDTFSFSLNQDDFLDIVFEGLEIPDMIKQALVGGDVPEFFRAGYVQEGSPNQLDPVKTLCRARPRRMAFRAPKLRRIKEIDAEVKQLEESLPAASPEGARAIRERLEVLQKERDGLERKVRSVPFLEKQDLRFRHYDSRPTPVAQAVMFALMDVSGSMEEWHKDMAKRYFLLLYLFLRRQYDRVEIVFIRHTQDAEEVDEEQFFYGKTTGGTIVSNALQLMQKIVEARYPITEWNIYGCHATDGDDWGFDLPLVEQELTKLLAIVQYYAYVEVRRKEDGTSELWETMERYLSENENLAIAQIHNVRDIYPVFRKLFEPK